MASNLVRPKVIYLARRNAELAPAAFKARWLQHGDLAMSLPIWRNMWKYAHCDPLEIDRAPIYDGVGLVWYKSQEHMDSIAREPQLRQPLLDDELLTFDRHVRETALLTHETILLDGPESPLKLFLFAKAGQARAALASPPAGAQRIVHSVAIDNAYTGGSRLPYGDVIEWWFADRLGLGVACRALAQAAPADSLVLPTGERQIFGPALGR